MSNPRVLSALAGVALACTVFGPSVAQASSLSSTQIDAIINLLQAFGADSSTVSNVQAVLENQPVGTSTGTNSSSSSSSSWSQSTSTLPNGCAVLSNGLHLGSTDRESEGEVSRLQQFLSKDSSIYPEGLVTGYFGTATEDAVQRWQAAHGIMATGTPDTTGFGTVGPQTRGEMDREMEVECEQGDSQGHGSGDHSENAQASSSPSHEGDN